MRILHLMLSNYLIDGYNYQENILPRVHQDDGHTVLVIASTETIVDKQHIGYIEPCAGISADGVPTIRIPYRSPLPRYIMAKVRSYPRVYQMIEEFSPDVILHHGVPAWELLTVAQYKCDHPYVRFYVDSHEIYENSARNYVSRRFLHQGLYRYVVRRALPHIDKILCTDYGCFRFLNDMYGVPDTLMEFYPLGGLLVDDTERTRANTRVRAREGISENDVVLVHSGKMDRRKRTEELLLAFSRTSSQNLKLLLIGSFSDEVWTRVKGMIESDSRVRFMGWKDSLGLIEYLCACDLYVQPGTPSVTMQQALCCGAAVAVTPREGHKFLLGDSAFYVDTVQDMESLFSVLSDDRTVLFARKKKCRIIAEKTLDYRRLAARIYL